MTRRIPQSAIGKKAMAAIPVRSHKAPLITGTVPTSATIALLNVTRDAPPAEVDDSLALAGCEAVSLVVNDNGTVRLYAAGAPAFANANVPTLRANGSVRTQGSSRTVSRAVPSFVTRRSRP